MIRLRRLGPGRWATADGRYQVERQDGLTECSHPMCYELHQRYLEGGVHWTTYPCWHVWDTTRDDYADRTTFETLREARAWLDAYLGRGQ